MRAIDRIRVWWRLQWHRLYLRDRTRYARFRADLSHMDLRGLDLSDRDLRYANFNHSDLSGCKFCHSDLSHANLAGTKVHDALFDKTCMSYCLCAYASFARTEFDHTDLLCSDFSRSRLRDCAFVGVCLRMADFCRAELAGVVLYGVDCAKADFAGATMKGVSADTDTTSFRMACPEKGAFTAFKKVSALGSYAIAELSVPAHALRSSATTRKCRVSEATVVAITLPDGTPFDGTAYSRYDSKFKYRTGETACVEGFDTDRWQECTTGIHCFMSYEEAVSY